MSVTLNSHNLLRKVTGVLALLGGFLIVVSGFGAHTFLLSILDLINNNIGHYLPGLPSQIATLAIYLLAILITLGGITVILGGIAILYGRVFTGSLLIALGGGAGFLGLAITLAYSIISSGLPSIFAHSEYWVGVILAAIARSLAKRK